MATFPIGIGSQGLYGGHNLSRVPAEFLLKAENIAFDDGCIRKEGGAAIYNSALPPAWTERSNPKNIALNDVAWNGSMLVAVGAADGTDSYIITSSDGGATWTEQAPTVAKNIALNAVAWSPLLSLWIAVGAADGTDGYILTSANGTTWTERSNPKNFALNDIVVTASNTGRVYAFGGADGSDAYAIESTDGTTWTEFSNPKNIALNGGASMLSAQRAIIVGAADGTDAYILELTNSAVISERANPKNIGLNAIALNGGTSSDKFVAVGNADGTDAYIITAPGNSSATWTEQAPTVAKNLNLYDVAWSGNQFLAVGAADGTDAYMVRSFDGITWIEVANGKNFDLNAVVWTGTQFVAVGAADGTDAYIVTAGNTGIWSEITVSGSKAARLFDIAFNGENYVAVGAADGTDAYILSTTDLSTWTERSNPKNFGLNAIIWNGFRYVAVGVADGTDAYIINSDDGETWTERSNPKNFALNDMAYNGLLLVAVGDADGTDAYLLTSQDGKNWTERANPKNIDLNSVVWTGSQFVAVGDNDGTDSYIITSPDGATWTEQTAPNNENLYGVEWSGSLLVAVGAADGTDACIITSSDGVTWLEKSNPSGVDLYSIVWNGLAFTTVGDLWSSQTIIMQSTDGTTWVEQSNPQNKGLNSVIWDGLNLVAVGAGPSNGNAEIYIAKLQVSPTYVLGATYWNYDGATSKIVALDTAGRLLMDGFDGAFNTILKSGLTVSSTTFPVFVEGGKEVAANNKKLFTFTGANQVQVLSGSGTTTSNLSSPPADWSGSNQPTGGLVHKNRLWGYGNANDPHRLYYSLTTNYEDFSGGSISVYPGEGEKIVNAISYKGYIIVWKYPKGIYIVDTTSTQTSNWGVDRVNEKLGGAGQGSASVVEEDVVFIDHTGEIRVVAGITEFGDIGSRSLSDIQEISVFIRDNYYLPSNTKWRMQYYSKKRELHIGASSNYLGINDNRMVIDFNGPTPRFRNSTRDTCLYLFIRELNGVPELMSCDNLGNIWRLDQSTKSKDGQGYTSQFQINYTDLGLPGMDKSGQALQIDFEPTGDVDLAIDVIWDGVYQETTSINLDSELEVQPGRLVLTKEVPLNGSGDRVSLIFRNNNAGEDYAIQGLRIMHDGAAEEEEEP